MQLRFVALLASSLALLSNSRETPSKQRVSALVLGERPRLMLGADVTDPEDELGWVIGATRLSNGRIAVADRGQYQVRVYDRSGRILSRVGRRGEGPGDFSVIERLWRGAGDSLFVFDYMLQRIQVFSPSGQFVRVWPSLAKLSGSLHAVGDYADGGVLFEYRIPSALPRSTGLTSYEMRLLRVSPSLQSVDTIGVLFGGETLVLVRDGRPTGSSHVPLGRYGFATARGDVTYYLDGAKKDVRLLGGPQVGVPLEGADATLSTKEREARISEYLESLSSMTPTFVSSVANALRRDLNRPSPMFDSLLVDRMGRIWAREIRRPSTREAQWLVLNPGRGGSLTVRLPSDWQLLEAGDGYVLVSNQNNRGRAVVMEYTLSERQ